MGSRTTTVANGSIVCAPATDPLLGRQGAHSRHALKYRLAVVAASVADAVRFAGGAVFDRSISGWEVTLFADGADADAVRILGARVGDLDALSDLDAVWPDAVLVSADAHAADDRIRAFVTAALDGGSADVNFWDAESGRAGSVAHGLSSAAQAFKEHALSACGLAGSPVANTESFRPQAAPAAT